MTDQEKQALTSVPLPDDSTDEKKNEPVLVGPLSGKVGELEQLPTQGPLSPNFFPPPSNDLNSQPNSNSTTQAPQPAQYQYTPGYYQIPNAANQPVSAQAPAMPAPQPVLQTVVVEKNQGAADAAAGACISCMCFMYFCNFLMNCFSMFLICCR